MRLVRRERGTQSIGAAVAHLDRDREHLLLDDHCRPADDNRVTRVWVDGSARIQFEADATRRLGQRDTHRAERGDRCNDHQHHCQQSKDTGDTWSSFGPRNESRCACDVALFLESRSSLRLDRLAGCWLDDRRRIPTVQDSAQLGKMQAFSGCASTFCKHPLVTNMLTGGAERSRLHPATRYRSEGQAEVAWHEHHQGRLAVTGCCSEVVRRERIGRPWI